MKTLVIKLALILLALVVVVSFAACASAQPSTQPKQPTQLEKATPSSPSVSKPQTQPQQVDVAPASQINKVSGSGNTAVLNDAKLTFGTGGKIEKLNVKKYDRVTKGMVLAKLETNTLELAVSQAKTALAQAQLAQSQAEVTYKQAEVAVETAKLTLDKIEDVSDIKDEITDIEWGMKVAEEKLKEASSVRDDRASAYWVEQIRNGRTNFTRKQKELADLLGKPEYAGVVTYDILTQKYDRWVVEDARIKQRQVEAAELSVLQARNSIEYAKSNVESVQKALEVAEKNLKDATITAPFDGVVGALDVKEGDIVSAPAQSQRPVIYLVDPTTMELNIGVNELDVPKVKIGQKAVISVDAFPDVKLEGKVTAISPMPGAQSRVVDYEVAIDFAVPPATEIRAGMSATAEIAVK